MAPYRGFDYRVEDGIGTVTFARPETLNSLTFEVYAELERLALECQSDDSVRVLVLTGTGKGFCSGGAVHEIIGELFKRDVTGVLQFTRMTGTVVRNLRLLEKPAVASINGIAAGAGAALASDFRVLAGRRHGGGVPAAEGHARRHDRRPDRRALRARQPRRAGRPPRRTRPGRSRGGSPTGPPRRSA